MKKNLLLLPNPPTLSLEKIGIDFLVERITTKQQPAVSQGNAIGS